MSLLVSHTVLPAFRSTGGECLTGGGSSAFSGGCTVRGRLEGGIPVQGSCFRADSSNRSFMKKSGVKSVCSQQPSNPVPRASGVPSPMII